MSYRLYSLCRRACHFSTYMHRNSPNSLRHSIFLLLIALLDTCTNIISRLGIVFKNERRQVNWNVEYRDGIKIKEDKIGMPCTRNSDIRHVIHSPRESTTQVYRAS